MASARAAAAPESRSSGLPASPLVTSICWNETPTAQPVPSALKQASFAANRAASAWARSARASHSVCSAAVKTRSTNSATSSCSSERSTLPTATTSKPTPRIISRPSCISFQLLPPLDPLPDRFFVTGVGGLVPLRSPQRFRQVLLRRIRLVVVVGVLVTLAVSQILHQTGRRIANVERHGLGRMLLGSGLRVSERGVRAVRL